MDLHIYPWQKDHPWTEQPEIHIISTTKVVLHDVYSTHPPSQMISNDPVASSADADFKWYNDVDDEHPIGQSPTKSSSMANPSSSPDTHHAPCPPVGPFDCVRQLCGHPKPNGHPWCMHSMPEVTWVINAQSSSSSSPTQSMHWSHD